MFPKTLPRAAVRRVIQNEKIRRELSIVQPDVTKASIKGNVIKMNLITKKKNIYLYCAR